MSFQSQNINNTFFEGVYKDVWREIIPAGLTEAEVDFITDVAAVAKGHTVLDVMCGYGRHAIELAKRGVQVTAIDNLDEYILEIKREVEKQNLPLQAITADVINVALTQTYDAAICMGNSFAFFNKEDSIRLLKKIASHLKQGGIFIINSWMIAEIAMKYFREQDWHYAGDYKCILENRFLFHPNRIESEQTIIAKDGLPEMRKGIDYIFTLDEMEEMFKAAGLTTKGLFSTPRKRKFSFGDTRIYIVVEKN